MNGLLTKTNFRWYLFGLLLSLALASGATSRAYAQAVYGSIAGNVTDSSERRLPTAVIDCGIGAVDAVIASTVTACALPAPLSAVTGPLAPPDPTETGALPAAPPAVLCWPNQ